MRLLLARFAREETGENLIEYGLLAAFVAALATAVVVSDPVKIEQSLKSVFKEVKKALDKAVKA